MIQCARNDQLLVGQDLSRADWHHRCGASPPQLSSDPLERKTYIALFGILAVRNTDSFMSKIILLLLFLISSSGFGQQLANQNSIEFKSVHKLISLVPIHDKGFETGHRRSKLTIYSEEDSSKPLSEHTLTVKHFYNGFFDFRNKFDGKKKFVVIQGSVVFFIYDVLADSLSEECHPDLSHENGIDAQSGQLTDIKLSKNGKILTMEARDFGNFSFNLDDPLHPKEIKRIK